MVALAAVAQLVERVLGKDEVMGSSPISSFRHATNQSGRFVSGRKKGFENEGFEELGFNT